MSSPTRWSRWQNQNDNTIIHEIVIWPHKLSRIFLSETYIESKDADCLREEPLLAHENDAFNGIIVDSKALPSDIAEFATRLEGLLSHALEQQKAVIWLTLPIHFSHFVGIATEKGFKFHNCLEEEITLVLKSKPSDFAPFVATHSLGAGGFAQKESGEILVIKEKGGSTYKLPGGHVELGEKVEDAVIREVQEETGIMTQFNGILGMASTHPYRFGKSNIYIICKLTALSEDINILDPDEIEDAKWMMPEVFLKDPDNSVFNKYLIKSLLSKKGLGKTDLDLSQFSSRKHEVFIAHS